MLTALEHYNEVLEDDIRLLKKVREWLTYVEDRPIVGNPPEACSSESLRSCHVLAIAARRVFNLEAHWRVVHGRFGSVDHSWLLRSAKLSYQPESSLVLDVYPVAAYGGPIFVATDVRSPWHGLYVEDIERYVRFNTDAVKGWYLEADALVAQHMDRKLEDDPRG